jgi:hypothetical protein
MMGDGAIRDYWRACQHLMAFDRFNEQGPVRRCEGDGRVERA